MIVQTLVILMKILSIIIPLLIAVAYFTLVERKIIGSIQRRHGPNVIGFLGLFQPLSDGLKLFTKEIIIPTNSNKFLFVVGPVLTFTLSLISWAVIPFSDKAVLADINLGIMYLLAVSTFNVYGVLISGWSSNSKYSLIGALRSSSQMLSYEISIGFIILNVSLCSGSLNLTDIVQSQKHIWYLVPLFPMFVVFCISMLAETNRHPFDLPEAEAELVSGYNVEYSGMFFGFFFLAEYINMLLMSALLTILFLGGWLPAVNLYPFTLLPKIFWFSIKICFGVVFFIITRASLPRYRYDQLMFLGWKVFLPLTIGYVLFTVSILLSFNWLPN